MGIYVFSRYISINTYIIYNLCLGAPLLVFS
nr:MAG TPA: hypothetical protein [Caudoviricetes sp.]